METLTHECAVCSAPFEKKVWSQRYCSVRCRNRNMNSKRDNRHFASRYNITRDQRDQFRLAQEFKCAICGRHEEELGRILYVDHCHETGMIRSMLCHGCNSSLGHFNDDPERLIAAAAYLIEHSQRGAK